jgi:hypothetical protein
MQLAVVDDKHVIIFDKAEHNPLLTPNGNNAWSALLNTHDHKVRPLTLKTNSFCAGELLSMPTSHPATQCALFLVGGWRFRRRGLA